MKLTGSCHCQKLRYEMETDIKQAMVCNCSICSRRGHVLHFLPMAAFKMLSSTESLSDYQWGKKTIHFTFCSTCGTAPFGRGTMPTGDEMMAVNLRCVENFDWEKLPIEKFDGKHQL